MICGEKKEAMSSGTGRQMQEGCVSLMPELSKLKNAIGFHPAGII